MSDATLPRRTVPPGRLETRRAHLVAELRRERRRRRLLLIAVPAVALLLAATAWTAHQLTRDVSHFESIGCYDRVGLDGNVTVLDPWTEDPVRVCSDLWREGVVDSDTHVAPALEACILSTGVVAVFPDAQACAKLDLAQPPADYGDRARRLGALRRALAAGLAGCVPPTEAVAIARRELEARGLDDWRVQVTGGDPGGKCARLGFDAKQVDIIPMSR